MKNIVIILIISLIFLVGCSSKSVERDLTIQNSSTTRYNGHTVEKSLNVERETVILVDDGSSSSDIDEISAQLDIDEVLDIAQIKSIYFNYNKYSLTDEMQEIAITNFRIIKKSSSTIFKIEGNCDEFGSDEYNYALGLKRAKTVKDAMVEFGINKNRLTLVTLGESNPVCQGHNQQCYQKNRRVDFKVTE